MKPLKRVQHHFSEEHKRALAEYATVERAYKRRLTECKKTGDDPGDAPEPPTAKRLYTHDATWEALHKLMGENPKGALLITMNWQSCGWHLNSQARKKRKGFYLSAWNGNDEITLDRIMLAGQSISDGLLISDRRLYDPCCVTTCAR